VCPSVRPSVRSQKVFFSDLHIIWCVAIPRPDMRTHMTSTRSKVKVKVKVMELLNFRKLHFSRSISSAIFAWSSKLMTENDSMGPGLQLIGVRFSNFLFRKLSREFRLHGMSISQNSNGHISVLHEATVTWLSVLVVLHVLCMLVLP